MPTQPDGRALANRLQERRWRERLTNGDAAWLTQWEDTHQAPPGLDEPLCTSDQGATELGLNLRGLCVLGACGVDELGYGNVHVAGGWYFQVENVSSANGWYRGFTSRLNGMGAFCDAFGVDTPEGSGDTLGPFYDAAGPLGDRGKSYEALAVRLLAALTHVSRICLSASPAANATAERQVHELDKRRVPGMRFEP